MYPKLINFNTPDFLQSFLPDTISIYSYGFCIALGVIVSYYIIIKKSKKFGLEPEQISSLITWVIFTAFVGGKLFYFLQDPQTYIDDPRRMLNNLSSGFVFYGSLLFAIPTIIYWLWKNKMPIRPFLDIMAYVGPTVHAFGRMGCLMAGCCYGKVCNSPLGITFTHPDSLAKPKNIPLYPTQLFDIFLNICILLVVYYFDKKKKFDGQLFLIYLILYAIGRSIVEIYRGDSERGFVFGNISHSQFIATFIILFSAVLWNRWKNNPRV